MGNMEKLKRCLDFKDFRQISIAKIEIHH